MNLGATGRKALPNQLRYHSTLGYELGITTFRQANYLTTVLHPRPRRREEVNMVDR